jgi:hypothetical protein
MAYKTQEQAKVVRTQWGRSGSSAPAKTKGQLKPQSKRG